MKRLVIFFGVVLTLICSTWAGTSPLTLEQGIRIALANNHSLQAASKSVTSAKEKISEAKSAFFPTLALSSNYTKLNEAPSFAAITIGNDDIYDLKATLQQPLFTGGKLSAGREMAEYSHRSAQYEYERVKQELILAVKSTYFGILKTSKFQQVATDSVKQVEAHLQIVHNLYNAGMVAKVDVLKAEVQLANTKQNLIKVENAVILAKALFNQILAQDQSASVDVVDILEFTPYQVNLDTGIKEALTKRPELKQIMANIGVLAQIVRLSKSNYYPSMSMIGNYDYQKGAKQGNDWEKTWMAGIMINYNLWDWKAKRSKVNSAEANLESLKAQQLALADAITLEVRQAYLSMEETKKNIDVAQKSIGQAEEGLRITEEMYKEGCATNTDVLDSQTMLTQTRTNYYQALYDYNLARAKLQKAMGGK
ncbi:TolC family protein [bacterium]|nr:TolC family protein [bacterium]